MTCWKIIGVTINCNFSTNIVNLIAYSPLSSSTPPDPTRSRTQIVTASSINSHYNFVRLLKYYYEIICVLKILLLIIIIIIIVFKILGNTYRKSVERRAYDLQYTANYISITIREAAFEPEFCYFVRVKWIRRLAWPSLEAPAEIRPVILPRCGTRATFMGRVTCGPG